MSNPNATTQNKNTDTFQMEDSFQTDWHNAPTFDEGIEDEQSMRTQNDGFGALAD